MPKYRLQHDFNAQESIELSVRKGDIVSTEAKPEDGWIEVTASNGAKGFVPFSFLKEATSPARTVPGPASGSGYAGTTRYGSGRSMSPASSEFGTLSAPAPVIETFMKNELFYKDLLRQRQEAMERLERIIGEAAADIATCKDKNSQLTRKLKDLDQLLDKERRKWKDRVDEEKLILTQKTASASSATPLFVNASPILHHTTLHTTTTTTTASRAVRK
jgi:hypothetical protein